MGFLQETLLMSHGPWLSLISPAKASESAERSSHLAGQVSDTGRDVTQNEQHLQPKRTLHRRTWCSRHRSGNVFTPGNCHREPESYCNCSHLRSAAWFPPAHISPVCPVAPAETHPTSPGYPNPSAASLTCSSLNSLLAAEEQH